MSPDHVVAAVRCCPANAERVRMYTRWASPCRRRLAWSASIIASEYELRWRCHEPRWWRPIFLSSYSLDSFVSALITSGSVESIHQASMPFERRPRSR